MIYCCASDCIHFHDGYCELDEIGISDNFHQCEEYVDYTDTKEYNTEFWRAVTIGGNIYKRKDKGKRAKKNDITFYYWDKELEPETKIIEEKTGRMTVYKRLKELPDCIEAILKEQGKVSDLPEWKEGDTNG